MEKLKNLIEMELLPNLRLESAHPNEPIKILSYPSDWSIVGSGNYAAVFEHRNFPQVVIKVYAPGRTGIEEEIEVYNILGLHPSYSQYYYSANNYLVLKRLHGLTLYECLNKGVPITELAIKDIDRALADAKQKGLSPRDIHPKNVLQYNGRGYIADISDFKKGGYCPRWDDLKKAYYRIYKPFIKPICFPIPQTVLNIIRKSYRIYRKIVKPRQLQSIKITPN